MKKSSYKKLSAEERQGLADKKAARQAKISAWQDMNTAFHTNYTKRNGQPMIFDQEAVTESLRRQAYILLDCSKAELYAEAMEEVERALITEVFKAVNSNQSHAASLLGINRGTLRAKLKKYNLIGSQLCLELQR